jgi:hypothetical protein
MKIQIPTADLKAAFTQAVSSAVSAGQTLSSDAQKQVQTLIDALYPLMVQETQEMLTATNPAVAQTYMAVLEGVVAAKIAELGLAALAGSRGVIASAIATTLKVLGLLLKAVVIA